MIIDVSYTSAQPSTAVAITMADGAVGYTDASLPPDTDIRRQLHDWLAAGGVITPYVEPPAPVPQTISRRQCARELLAQQMISGAEAIAMTQTGAPPAMVQAVFDAMPEPDRTLAVIDFAADTYARDNPLLVGIMQAANATDEEIDDFFRKAAAQ